MDERKAACLAGRRLYGQERTPYDYDKQIGTPESQTK